MPCEAQTRCHAPFLGDQADDLVVGLANDRAVDWEAKDLHGGLPRRTRLFRDKYTLSIIEKIS